MPKVVHPIGKVRLRLLREGDVLLASLSPELRGGLAERFRDAEAETELRQIYASWPDEDAPKEFVRFRTAWFMRTAVLLVMGAMQRYGRSEAIINANCVMVLGQGGIMTVASGEDDIIEACAKEVALTYDDALDAWSAFVKTMTEGSLSLAAFNIQPRAAGGGVRVARKNT